MSPALPPLARLLPLLLVFLATLSAQSNSGALVGVVRDSSGGLVPSAAVNLTDLATGAALAARTSESGVYSFPALRPVLFRLNVTAPGFQTAVFDNIKIDTSRTTTQDVTLQPGSLSETVRVSAEAPLLETSTGAVVRTIDERAMLETPLNGRNVIELALTLPGVSGVAGSEFAPTYNSPPMPGRDISISGGRGGTTQFTADGMNITSVGLARTTVSFSPDSIQEFSVLQSNYSAEYSVAGGGIIQQTTKSGSNDYHGTAYWFHRQKALSANPFNSTRQEQFNYDNRPPLRRQQLGIVFSGPVVLPKIYHGRNKTFFFASYEPTRQVTGNVGGASFIRVPSDLELKGDFSQSMTYDAAGVARPYPLLYNHFTADSSGVLHYLANPKYDASKPASPANPMYQYVFDNTNLFNPGGGAAAGRVLVDGAGRSLVNPVAQKIASTLYPRPAFPMILSGANAGSNYAYFSRTLNFDDRRTVRLDHLLTDKHRLSFRWTDQPGYGDRFNYSIEGNPGNSDTSEARQALLTVSSALRPTLINEFRAGFVRTNFSRNFPSYYLDKDGTSQFLDIGGAGQGTPNPAGFGIANFMKGYSPANNAKGFGELGQNGVQNIGRDTEASFSLSDQLAWVQSNRTWKFGIEANQLQANLAASGYGYLAGGVFSQSGNVTNDGIGCSVSAPGGVATALPSNCRAATARTGDNFASFLLGVPGNPLMYENIMQPYYYRWNNVGSYVQHDWKVRRNLTLNAGVRWQFQPPRFEKYNRQGQLNMDRFVTNPYVKDAAGNSLTAPVFEYAGVGGRSRYTVPVHYADFEPRFGFAWTPDYSWNSAHRLVVRGGFGIAHVNLTGNSRQPYPNLGSKLDAFRAYNVAYGTNDLFNPGNIGGCGLAICQSDIPMQFGYNNIRFLPDPSLYTFPNSGLIQPSDAGRTVAGVALQDTRYNTTGFVFDQTSRTPRMQTYSLQVQYELVRNTVLVAGYQGSHGVHLASPDIDINNDPITGVKRFPGYNGTQGGRIMLLNRTGSSSVYHAGMLELNRRFDSGLQFNLNYTYSKSIDDSSGGVQFDYNNLAGQDSSALGVRINAGQNSGGRTNERAVSNFNMTHVINFNGFYELPLGRGRRWLNHGGWLEHLAGGWQLAGLSRVYSGAPLFVDLGNGNNIGLTSNTGLSNPRPDILAGQPLLNPAWTPQNATSTPYLNPAAFLIPEPGHFGNAARNFNVHGPWMRVVDLSIYKNITPFADSKRRIQLRAEVYNVFNMKNWGYNGAQTNLFTGLNQNLTGLPNRYGNLNAQVWNAILAKDPSSLSGSSTVTGAGTILAPAALYTELSGYLNQNFYRLDPNVTQARVIQLALKFYF